MKPNKEKPIILLLVTIIIICLILLMFTTHNESNKTSETSKQNETVKEPLQDVTTYEGAPTIMLDAGHGGYDGGCVGADGTLEKDITMEVTGDIGRILVNKGYNVVYTRYDDKISWPENEADDLATRVQMSIDKGADYYISIHVNFNEYSSETSGFESFVNLQNETSINLASSIHKQLAKLNYTEEREILDGVEQTTLYVVASNQLPSVLLEIGFMSNDNDLDYMKEHPDKIAKAVAKGIQNSIPLN